MRVQIPSEDHYEQLIACQAACPVHTDARGYVRALAEGRVEDAYLIARGPNPFASICGRICGAPCEAACRRGTIPRVDDDGRFVANDRPIAIRALKRFACEQAGPESRPATEPASGVIERLRHSRPPVAARAEEMASLLQASIDRHVIPASGESIAIIGAGPAGLSAAHDLALLGFRPVVFETERVPAGMLALGVPGYRLPRDVIAREVAVIEALGVEIRCGITVGREVTFADLRRDFAAVIIAVGAKSSRPLNLPGERGPRVYGGVDLLRAVALAEPLDIGRDVVVIGGGNVAYDVARTVVRQIAYDTARAAARLPTTANVHLVSLESLEDMPADTVEIREGDEEGIVGHHGWGPVAIERDEDGRVTAVRFRKCLRVYDAERRFAPQYDDAQEHSVPCDTVLLAVGQAPRLDFLEGGASGVEFARPGWPRVDTNLATTAPGVFVAGDLAHGTRLLIDAVASGKAVARSVYQYVTGRALHATQMTAHLPLPGYRRERGYESIRRQEVPAAHPGERLAHPDVQVEIGYTRAQAMCEASRCLDCGVTPVFDGSRCVLCGGCVDVCPTLCLKIVSLDRVEPTPEWHAAIERAVGPDAALAAHSAILKDEDRCIRCALCAMRCPSDAIAMERVTFHTTWRSA
ncbi:MAG: FAD-dependent oxidoreductase [Acidobacteria bacterium]|nr:FAD-dependent oxidoreductase [Acidobacteriota bacterium]